MNSNNTNSLCLTRRQLLLAGAGTIVFTSLPGLSQAVELVGKQYARKLIGNISALAVDTPLEFKYPHDDLYSSNILVKLGVPAGAGVGDDHDIVAFSHFCTHMGGPLQGSYKGKFKAMGPCPFHLTTFDLTRHGMVIAGHATESLPQVMLETEGDEIYAIGVMGLVYGRNTNLS